MGKSPDDSPSDCNQEELDDDPASKENLAPKGHQHENPRSDSHLDANHAISNVLQDRRRVPSSIRRDLQPHKGAEP